MLGFLTGLLLGAGHAVSGPDHLAAVAPLATGRRAWRVGFSWGAGHAGGVVVVALALASLGAALELETLGSWGERIVGVSLIGMGAWMLLRPPRSASTATKAAAPAAAVGLLHGVAGGSHLYAALPAVALADGAVYLAGFALGAVLTMGVFAGVLGRVALTLGPRRRRALARGLAVLTLLVGVAWLGLG